MLRHGGMAAIDDGLILSGYQKKLKTMKKKYFVLYKETVHNSARLEYYDNERKFKSGLAPKKVLKLRNCFNINRRLDTKYDYVIALSTKDGGFGIVLENEVDMLKWLEVLISLQRSEAAIAESIRPHFEHVWQVVVQRKGLAEERGIVGNYHVCLTPKSVTFIRIGVDKITDSRISNVEILLTTIRRCGDSQCFFYMEVGRQSVIGPGELWMETEDSLIAQNMHHMILSAMSNKTDSNLEPMRKRSSSANEASKPINVLHRRPTQPENKTTNSPQTIMCYGRERCDSLPSRNRTSSECSNQSFTGTSVLSIRNNTISGLRTHSYQRHSNSPPLNSTIGCSESEESSISIDEPDDNGSFVSYRFNSRSSEGVIPEENTDELVSSENKWNDTLTETDVDKNTFKVPDVVGENYVSMAPVRPTANTLDKNMLNHCSLTNSIEDSMCVSHAVHQGSSRSDIEFPEYTADNVYKTYGDIDTQYDRPIRAYSIGSKVEHNKSNKRLGNANDGAEQSTIRVRAFSVGSSVGSRAKIPRCDLQRGILYPKAMIEQNFNSNNNICCLSDAIAYNQMLNISTSRDKKSTSAPLLIHKSHNSVDRMSDLMEIDFSKSSNHTSNRMYQTTKAQFSKSVPSTTREAIQEFDPTKSPRDNDLTIKQQNNTTPIITKPIAKVDNGYLEMRPIGSSPKSNDINNFVASHEYPDIKSKAIESSEKSLNKETVLLNKRDRRNNSQCNIIPTEQDLKRTDINQIKIENDKKDIEQKYISSPEKPGNHKKALNEELNKSCLNAEQSKKLLAFNLSNKYSQLSLNSVLKQENDISNKDDYINIDRNIDTKNNMNGVKTRSNQNDYRDIKLCHSSSSTPDQNPNYEILQIKSDNLSLQAQKNRQTNSNTSRKETQQNQLINQNRPKSANSSSLISSSSPSSANSSGQTSASSNALSTIATIKDSSCSPGSGLNDVRNTKTHLNVTSRPSSITSEHELYYASLDLPQCSSEINTTKPIKVEALNESSVISVPHMSNSYAKIDFEHSDSSSSSSKNLNV